MDAVQTWRYSVDARQYGFFLAKKISPWTNVSLDSGGTDPHNFSDAIRGDMRPTTPGTPGHDIGFTWTIGCLADYERGFFDSTPLDDRYVCFADPSNYAAYPGWMLRNLLVLIRERFNLEKVRILCYRDIQSRRDEARSVVLDLHTDTHQVRLAAGVSSTGIPEMPKVTGWERNDSGKVLSKVANLGEYLDPRRYASYGPSASVKN